jgi:hypothetical protein
VFIQQLADHSPVVSLKVNTSAFDSRWEMYAFAIAFVLDEMELK